LVDEWVGCGRLQVGDKWEKVSAKVDGEADDVEHKSER
jgi:hypothetical protein